MLSVIMGAPTYKVRNRDASMLLNYGFSRFEMKKLVIKDGEVEKIMMGKDEEKFIVCKAKDDFSIIVEKGKEVKVEKKCKLDSNKKGFKKGQVIGECEIYVDGALVGKVKVYSDRNMKKAGIFENIQSNFKRLFKNAI